MFVALSAFKNAVWPPSSVLLRIYRLVINVKKEKKTKTDPNIKTNAFKCIKVYVWRRLKHNYEKIKGDGLYCPFMGVGERSLRTNNIEKNC